MAAPNSKETLKEYCLRSLGKPVIEINVDPDQCDDRIDEALQYFAEYHMDGVERLYLKHQITSAEKTAGRTDISSSITDAVDNTVSATWKEQKVWLPLPTSIVSVLRILPVTNSTTVPMFDLKYQMNIESDSKSVNNFCQYHCHIL